MIGEKPQLSLFKDLPLDEGLSMQAAADRAKVSTATIRNWIKASYFQQLSTGLIDPSSFQAFLEANLGSEKLMSRANKQYRDQHDHDALVDLVFRQLASCENDVHDMGQIYEASLSNAYRNQEGVYYTPAEVVKDLLKDFYADTHPNLTFCDPCCGAGNFLIGALEAGFLPENIYGFDIDPVAVSIAKARIKEKTGYESNHIVCCDYLSHPSAQTFDFIFTNPPWGKKISQQEKKYYINRFSLEKMPDTSVLFFLSALSQLNHNGKLGFLLPDAFFNIASFELARKKALAYQILRLVDYGNVFSGLMTGAQALVIAKNGDVSADHQVICQYENNRYFRYQHSFYRLPKHIFNFYCNENDAQVIAYLYNLDHVTLKQNARWGLGIVTGNNARYIVNKYDEDYIPVIKGTDITVSGLKEPTSFIPKELSLYQQVAPIYMYEAKEKLVYKFISTRLNFVYDNAQRYLLNSANMLVLNEDFPLSHQQLAVLLNSDVMNWIYKRIFNTHKVLRGDIEYLPIHYLYYQHHDNFEESCFLAYLGLEKVDEYGTYRIALNI